MSNFLVYLYLVIFIIVDIAILAMGVEQLVGFFIKKQAPEVPSSQKLRSAVIKQILIDVPNAKTILDIGSGWGTMVRSVAGAMPDAMVFGAEIMPTPYLYSFIRCLFIKNKKLFFGDAFKYLENSGAVFDVGIVYLITSEMGNVQKFLSRFQLLIAVDFPLPDVKPSMQVKLHKDIFCQHWLYVYKN